MQKTSLSCLCLLILIGGLKLNGQPLDIEKLDEKTLIFPTNVIKTNPLALIISQIPFTGEARLMYERAFSHRNATMVGISYVFPNFLIIDSLQALSNRLNLTISMAGFRVQAAQKVYLSSKKRAPYGLYIAPHASVYSARIYIRQNRSFYLNTVFTNVSLIAGYQIIIMDALALDVYTGLGYRYNFLNEKNGVGMPLTTTSLHTDFPYRSHVKLTFSINAGIFF